MEEIDGQGRRIRRRVDGMEGWVSQEMLFFRRAVILGAGSSAMVPRAVFQEIGGFDESLPPAEDWDFCYRIARRFRVGFVPEVLVRYRLHGGNAHANVFAMTKGILGGYAKVFEEQEPSLQRLRRRAYGNLHSMLAGSFFHMGEYRQFIRHAFSSIILTPENGGHFAGYPFRAIRRRGLGLRQK
jgi:hypothetical protein